MAFSHFLMVESLCFPQPSAHRTDAMLCMCCGAEPGPDATELLRTGDEARDTSGMKVKEKFHSIFHDPTISKNGTYIRGEFTSQTSDSMDKEQTHRWEQSEERKTEERRTEKRKSQKKENTVARKGRKVAKFCVFPMFCGSRRSKSRLQLVR